MLVCKKIKFKVFFLTKSTLVKFFNLKAQISSNYETVKEKKNFYAKNANFNLSHVFFLFTVLHDSFLGNHSHFIECFEKVVLCFDKT